MMDMQPVTRLTQAQAVITGLFPIRVGVGVTNPQLPQPRPMGAEADHLALAVPARRNEFAAGRVAARQALAALGHDPVPIPAGADRAPIWPAGIAGSISHSKTLCAAVLTPAPVSLGLDIEEDVPLSAGLLPEICSASEQGRIAGPDQLHLAKLIFSAKEAVYKAQYPISGMLFGFDHIDISLDLPGKSFQATFLRPAGRFAAGAVIQGWFERTNGHLVTAAMTGQDG